MRLDAAEPVIGVALQRDDVEARRDELDERQEQLPVQAIAVKVRRRKVGGGDDDGSRRQQPLEQPAHDHRVRNVGDLHFIEAQQPRFRGNGFRHRPNGVLHP